MVLTLLEEGMQIREDLTVIMVAPKCPGFLKYVKNTKEVLEYPTLIAVPP